MATLISLLLNGTTINNKAHGDFYIIGNFEVILGGYAGLKVYQMLKLADRKCYYYSEDICDGTFDLPEFLDNLLNKKISEIPEALRDFAIKGMGSRNSSQ